MTPISVPRTLKVSYGEWVKARELMSRLMRGVSDEALNSGEVRFLERIYAADPEGYNALSASLEKKDAT